MGKQHHNIIEICQAEEAIIPDNNVYSVPGGTDIEFIRKARKSIHNPLFHRENNPGRPNTPPYAAEVVWGPVAGWYRLDKTHRREVRQPSATELVIKEFLARVKDIPGILAVRTYGGKVLADQSILVEVPDLRSAAADQVYDLRGNLFRQYPDARLDVRVTAIRREEADPTTTTNR